MSSLPRWLAVTWLLCASGCLDLEPGDYAFEPFVREVDAGRPFTRDDARHRVSAGFAHACAVQGDASVVCWGRNWSGEVSPEVRMPDWLGPQVDTSVQATAVAAGNAHSCAIAGTRVSCWGSNREKQLGHRDRLQTDHFRNVVELDPTAPAADVLASREATCVRDGKRQLLCWGDTRYFAGSQTANWSHVPTTVALGVDRAATGGYATCWTSDGGAGCVTGFFRAPAFALPPPVAPVDDVVLGDQTTICLVAGGGLTCEASGDDCTAGPEPQSSGAWFAPVVPAPLVTGAVAPRNWDTDSDASCWIDASDRLWCWGTPPLPPPTGVTYPACQPFEVMSSVAHVALGEDFGCYVTTGADLLCFGNPLMVPPYTARPGPVPPTYVMSLRPD